MLEEEDILLQLHQEVLLHLLAVEVLAEFCVTSPTNQSIGGQQCKALYDFKAENSDELSFSAGDVINFIAKETDDWWRGEAGGKQGIFPG